MKKVALLATGDEIIQGDILNTNSQQISLRITEHNIPIGMHLTVRDNTEEIERAIDFLLRSHQALIITGGLGPTSDDLTRYALGNLIQKPLKFDDFTWEQICQRLKRFGYDNPPESNRQQAYFPEGADIIPNPNGTAAGCKIKIKDQYIFMLPGPPAECLPMVDSIVIPTLTQANFLQEYFREKWILFGVSEGKIAEELDLIVKPFAVTTGYRLCYPYLEFKLSSLNKTDFIQAVPLIENIIKPYLIGNGKQFASEQIKNLITHKKQLLGICDLATGGQLENLIKTPTTAEHILFSTNVADFHNIPYVLITGLKEYWQQHQEIYQTSIQLLYQDHKKATDIEANLPFRGHHVKSYAVEWICQQLFKVIIQRISLA